MFSLKDTFELLLLKADEEEWLRVQNEVGAKKWASSWYEPARLNPCYVLIVRRSDRSKRDTEGQAATSLSVDEDVWQRLDTGVQSTIKDRVKKVNLFDGPSEAVSEIGKLSCQEQHFFQSQRRGRGGLQIGLMCVNKRIGKSTVNEAEFRFYNAETAKALEKQKRIEGFGRIHVKKFGIRAR